MRKQTILMALGIPLKQADDAHRYFRWSRLLGALTLTLGLVW